MFALLVSPNLGYLQSDYTQALRCVETTQCPDRAKPFVRRFQAELAQSTLRAMGYQACLIVPLPRRISQEKNTL